MSEAEQQKCASCGEEGIISDKNICDKCKMVKYAIAEGIESVTKECTSCDQNVNNITKDLNSVAMLKDISTCAACGKKGNNDDMNTCNTCKMVKYCNAACKKKHRSKHKKACERRVAELHDEKLFKQPPTLDDCPICFLRLPRLESGRTYMQCCGKIICSGCVHAFRSRATKKEHDLCPFCRTPPYETDEEDIKKLMIRMEAGDAEAIFTIGNFYSRGQSGLPQNYGKALELYHRAGDLGHAESYASIGVAYDYGEGVEVDKKMAVHYSELAAMRGDAVARHNLGIYEQVAGNMYRALKHWMIAIRSGDANSLKRVQLVYSNGHASKDDYSNALRLYQEYLNEVKSDQRDEAATFSDQYKYY